MNGINREDVRKQVVNMLGDLKSLTVLYMENDREAAKMESNTAPDFVSCITLISVAEKPLMLETITGIATKFAGNRQALLERV